MKRLLFCALCATTLAGCDNVDISKYPENIQKCYNGIIYDDKNCTSSKKAILNYCQCAVPAEENLANEINSSVGRASSMGLGFAFVFMNPQEIFEKKVEPILDSCAEKTGYTRAKNCKSNKK